MEGILWKWTNYWNGWQTRWFSLEEGVLAYYKSQEEVTQGCKGSIKVIACEIIVNPVDTTRMDLVIPNEQHLYLKAASSQERQRWLVALGSAKACVDMGPGSSENNSKAYDGIPDTHSLKSKKSELRLYCDLLMQQVHMVKEAAGTDQQRPNVEKLNEATGLLTATCDTFINTLEECMEISNAKFLYESMPNTHNNVLNLPPLPAPNPPISIRKISKTVARSNSQDR